MQQRIDLHKLIDMAIKPALNEALNVWCCDDPVIKHLLFKNLKLAFKTVPKIFENKNAFEESYTHFSQTGLFEQPAPCIINTTKITEKQLLQELEKLILLQKNVSLNIFILIPTSLRNSLKDFKLENFVSFLPSENELLKCIDIIKKQWSKSLTSEIDASHKQKLIYNYGNDLVAIDMHFERMAQSGVDFEDAFISTVETNSFAVIDSLCHGNKLQLQMRLKQCEMAGEEASAILGTVFHFLKQQTAVHAEMQKHNNPNAAVSILPYPAQAKALTALKHLDFKKIADFLYHAAEIERAIRTQKNSYVYLSNELNNLLG